MKPLNIVLIEGDGIGPEITSSAVKVLLATGIPIDFEKRLAGLKSLETNGQLVPDDTIQAIGQFGYALKGPFTTPSGGTQRSPNWVIRQKLKLFSCVRPLKDLSKGIDIVIIRENTEDLYGAIEWASSPDVMQAVKIATKDGCERISKFAMNFCRKERRKKITIVHKANNLKLTEGLFLQQAKSIAVVYPEILVDDMLVDTAAYRLVTNPETFDVILTSNTFGDILSSAGAALVGGLGIAPSVSYGKDAVVAEATHGSAPDIAGKGIANPIGIISASAMLLKATGLVPQAELIDQAINWACKNNVTTPDMGGTASTSEVADEITKYIKSRGGLFAKNNDASSIV
ncbi:isocitrate/isopropylmalate dehydrogenase family protein [Paenibacillus alvei]|uniref:isocitrate/isopropylmalate dehydrogenase family protein n=1 Tax=Paenibacillus alvei TaxID=44250 RepID=UPI00227FC340|nr:isocitrate/isopropylmalate family dehydrogenase [Paenibacillus alvei]